MTGGLLCRRLLARVPGVGVFATTHPHNLSMIRILRALDFARSGRPFRRRGATLALFVRPASRRSLE